MKRWMWMLGGLIVWAAHFFAIYAAASIFPGERTANILALLATLGALIVNGLLIRMSLARRKARLDRFDSWTWRLAASSAAISIIAVIWQGLPAMSPAGNA